MRWSPAGAASLLAAAVAVGACQHLPTEPARVAPATTRGITFIAFDANGYATAAALSSLDALAAVGANRAVLVVTAYQSDATASSLRTADPRTPSRASVLQAIAHARSLGLQVAFKPHVDVDDGTWRARIVPGDAHAWFASYRRFIDPWAGFADSAGVVQFVVGTELAGTLADDSEWHATIQDVRARFRGELTYAASWDEAAEVPFWSDLDLVGIDFYFPVCRRADAGRLEILAGWQPWLARLQRLHAQTGRRILLTEIGYRSIDGAGMHPADFTRTAPLDPTEQADLYWAALTATGSEPWLAGLYWWDWPADDSGGPLDGDYTPRGKPAASELSRAWNGSASRVP